MPCKYNKLQNFDPHKMGVWAGITGLRKKLDRMKQDRKRAIQYFDPYSYEIEIRELENYIKTLMIEIRPVLVVDNTEREKAE